IVDVLEIVDVDERESETPVTARQNGLDALADEAAVGKAGELVVIGKAEQLGFRARALGDVDGARETQALSGDLRGARGDQEGARAIGAGEGLDDGNRGRRGGTLRKLR